LKKKSKDITEEKLGEAFQGSMALKLLSGDDYDIDLTSAQTEHFANIFDTIASDVEVVEGDEIPMEFFSRYIENEARAQGSAMKPEQIKALVDASGIDEDGNGSLSKNEFLLFLRSLFHASIPAEEVDVLKTLYCAAVAEAEADGDPMDEHHIKALFSNLGFDVDCPSITQVLGVVDADGDGEVDFDEFLAGIGMMKRILLESRELDRVFSEYKNRASLARRSLHHSRAAQSSTKLNGTLRKSLLKSMSQFITFSKDSPKLDASIKFEEGVDLDAADLEAFLGVSPSEAEEMIFLADQDEDEEVAGTIDRAEFQALIKNWS